MDPSDELVRRAQQGDAAAFTQLCEPCRPRLWRVICAAANPQAAEDLMQETLFRAWQSLPGFRRDAPFEAWLCRIAVNCSHDHLRSAWKRRVVQWVSGKHESDCGPHPMEIAEQSARRREVLAKALALPAKPREAIWLHYFEEFSFAEIARLQQLPESTVRSQVASGLRQLRGKLADWEPRNENEPARISEPQEAGIGS